MATDKYHLRVRNWDRFQRYKDRSPSWIMFHTSVLDDPHFEKLPVATKSHIMLIWLLASRTDNELPLDSKWIGGRIGAHEPVDIGLLVEKGYLEVINEEGTPLSKKMATKAVTGC